MSTASASRTIKFISKSGTYTSMVMCSDGDLCQYYELDSSGNPTNLSPNWANATTKPLLQLVVSNSRQQSGDIICNSTTDITAKIDGQAVSFDTNGVSISTDSAPFAGLLTKYVSSDKKTFGLKVSGNFATLGMTPQSHVITISATVKKSAQDPKSDTVEGMYTINVLPKSDNAYKCTIVSPDTRNFVIDRKYETSTSTTSTPIPYSVKLQAITTLNGTKIGVSGDGYTLSVAWQKLGTSGWGNLGSEVVSTSTGGVTNDTLTVKESDIDTYGEYRAVVTVTKDGTSNTYSDQQSVMDKTDPWDIEVHPIPADETIYEDLDQFPAGDKTSSDETLKNRALGQITYKPEVVTRPLDGTAGTKVNAETKFYFIVKDAAGNICNKDDSNPARDYRTLQTQFTLDQQMIAGVSSDVTLTIVSDDIDSPTA